MFGEMAGFVQLLTDRVSASNLFGYVAFSARLRVFRIILVLAGCLHLCGGHYGVLQVLAWGGMIVDYSAKEGLAEGVKQTFDGDHPCELCRSIAKAKQDEREAPENPVETTGSGLALKNLMAPRTVRISDPRHSEYLPPAFASLRQTPGCLRLGPEPPPPRIA